MGPGDGSKNPAISITITISISILRMRVFCLLLRSFFLLLEVCTGPEISAI